MAQLTADFEAGTNGNTIAAADPGSATAWNTVSVGSGNTITYDTAHPAFGSLGAKFVIAAANAGYCEWSTALGGTITDHYGRCYLYFTANPSAVTNYPLVGAMTAASRAIRVDIVGTGGQLRIFDSPGTSNVTTTNSVALNQLIRLEWHFVHSATTGQAEIKLFNTASSSTPTETLTSPANWNTSASADAMRFGMPQPGAAFTFWMDNIIANATSYPGPVPVSSSVASFNPVLLTQMMGGG